MPFPAMRLVFSLLLACALLAPAPAAAQITTEVSETTDIKRIESKSMRSLHADSYAGSHASYRAAYVNDPDQGISWVISVYGFTSSKTQMSRANSFRVTADGRQFEPVRLESKTRSVDDRLLEIKRATFPRSAFTAIANAMNVTISIGGAQFSAIKPRREDLRLILREVPTDATPRTASSDAGNR